MHMMEWNAVSQCQGVRTLVARLHDCGVHAWLDRVLSCAIHESVSEVSLKLQGWGPNRQMRT